MRFFIAILLLSSFGLPVRSMQQLDSIKKLNIPLSLKFISALKLAEMVGEKPEEYVKNLPIPEELKPYLIMATLLKKVMPANKKDALVAAIAGRINDGVIELVNRYINAESTGIDLSRGLACAALVGNKEALELLLKAGANVNCAGPDDITALMVAILSEKIIRSIAKESNFDGKDFIFYTIPTAQENEQIIEGLLKAGADATIRTDGASALDFAAIFGKKRIVKLLLGKGAPFDNRILLEVVKEGHAKIAKLLIRAGADINVKETNGDSALMEAVKKGHDKIIRMLLDFGADAGIKNKKGYSALDVAAMAGNKGAVKLLLSIGAPFSDLTLLQMIEKSYTKIAKLLIKFGSDVNVINGICKDTALIEAARSGNDKIVKILLDYGASVNVRNILGNTALYYAASSRSKKSVELLLSHNAKVNGQSTLSPLAVAAEQGDIDIVKLLLDSACGQPEGSGCVADVNAENCAALVVAAINGHKEITQLLLKQDPNNNSKAKFRALAGAIGRQQVEIVKLLLTTGIDFYYQDNESDIKGARNGLLGLIAEFSFFSCLSNNIDKDSADMLLLKLAIIRGNKEIIELLIPFIDFKNCSFISLTLFLNSLYNNYQDPDLIIPNKVSKAENKEIVDLITAYIANIQDSNGDTPLMIAVRLGFTTLVQKLIEKGDADMQLQNNNGLTALTLAVMYDRNEIANLCINKEAGLDQRAVEQLLRIAALNNSLEVAKLLLEYNVDVNSFDSQGNTPLMIAVKACAIDIVKLLLDHNAHVNRQDNKGYTALMELMAANQSQSAYIRKEIASLLLNRGADSSLKNDEGKTALDLAIEAENSVMVNLLMYYKAKNVCNIC